MLKFLQGIKFWTPKSSYLGMYRILSASTKPTLKNMFVAGRNGNTSKAKPIWSVFASLLSETIEQRNY